MGSEHSGPDRSAAESATPVETVGTPPANTPGAHGRILNWCVPRSAVEWPRLTNGSVELLPHPHRVGSRNSHLTAKGRRPILAWPADGRVYDCDWSCVKVVIDDDGAQRSGK